MSVTLTAARFDMLYELQRHSTRDVLQSELRRSLGVTASTVSRMLGSLEELGLITRCPPETDRRQRVVELTDKGRACIARAIQALIKTGIVHFVMECALAGDNWSAYHACLAEMEGMESVLRRVRVSFRDTGSVRYPWHPDD